MEQEWYNPVEILKPGLQQIMKHITNSLSLDIQNSILQAKINIVYDNRPELLRTPSADLTNNTITIQDVYMAYLWCCSYATVAVNKMYYHKAKLDQDVVTFADQQDMPKVNLTFSWACSLNKRVTHWPEDAARPDKADKWSEEATNLFQACVAYILYHEIGHLILHSGLKELLITRRKADYKMSDEEIRLMYDAETEADIFALESLIADSVSHEVLLVKFLGATLAQLSNFYLREVADVRGGLTHPDLDDRLRAVIGKTKLWQEADQIQLQAHISNGLQLFLHLTHKSFIPEDSKKANFKDFKELEIYLFSILTEMKNAARDSKNYYIK